VVLGCLALGLPAALGAAPANDNFDGAQVLEDSLPIGVSATNVEATKEAGEPFYGFAQAGHSVWFEWEATIDGFVTAGTCGSDFTTVTAVFTGTKLDELTEVAGSYNSEGPGCPSFDGREITFEATSGTVYEIAVDGNAFYMPPAQPPTGEGAIELQIKATPVPSNDDFADAEAITGSISEEPGAEFAYYWATVRGSNWNASKESGEPDHAGDPGGASVWYSWTAPASGMATTGTCEGKPLVVGVYMGDSLGTLTPVGSHEYPCAATFPASAGTTYRIAMDGEFDAVAAGPAMRSFNIHVSMQLPPRPPTPANPAPAVDTAPPNTTIVRYLIRSGARRGGGYVVESTRNRAGFGFESTEPGSTFRCRLDRKPFAACRSPRAYRNLPFGPHTFKVAAVDAAGNADPTPAVFRFNFPRTRHRKG